MQRLSSDGVVSELQSLVSSLELELAASLAAERVHLVQIVEERDFYFEKLRAVEQLIEPHLPESQVAQVMMQIISSGQQLAQS